MANKSTISTAVVVGVCAHGLAIVRSLAKNGIPVVALEANQSLPGFHTRHAKIIRVDDINGHGLIDALKNTVTDLNSPTIPVLFLTNDNMVRIVGEHWHEIDGLYKLSWSHCRSHVLQLLDKRSLQEHCDIHGLPYPKTVLLTENKQLESVCHGLQFPLIVKPAFPLSRFKVRLVNDLHELKMLADKYNSSLPFLLQRWITGGDQQLLFTAFYLDRGKILATFQGRKLASWPPALGQTTVAQPYQDNIAFEITKKFFETLSFSGPVSLEIKIDKHGKPWIIEPTLGRTDYWLDCCTANGVNLPLIEHQAQTLEFCLQQTQKNEVIWFDTESRPFSYIAFILNPNKKTSIKVRARFTYFDISDLAPFFCGLKQLIRRALTRLRARLIKNLNI